MKKTGDILTDDLKIKRSEGTIMNDFMSTNCIT